MAESLRAEWALSLAQLQPVSDDKVKSLLQLCQPDEITETDADAGMSTSKCARANRLTNELAKC